MKNKKTILNLLFLLLVFALTLYYVFHGEDMGALAAYLKQADVRYWIAGTVLVVIFILSESVIIYYMMRSVGQPVILTHCFLYSFVGFFFSAITPSATGGQPAQLYFAVSEPGNWLVLPWRCAERILCGIYDDTGFSSDIGREYSGQSDKGILQDYPFQEGEKMDPENQRRYGEIPLRCRLSAEK